MTPSSGIRGSLLPSWAALAAACCSGVRAMPTASWSARKAADAALPNLLAAVAVAREHRLDHHVLDFLGLAAAAGGGDDLLRIEPHLFGLLRGDRCAVETRAGPPGDKRRVRHVIPVSVADQDRVRFLHVLAQEPERPRRRHARVMRVQQQDRVPVGDLVVG
jgi:hypothetical protein